MVIDFHCTECGECCKNINSENVVFIFQNDANRISEYLKITIEEFYSRYCEKDSIETVRGIAEIYLLKGVNGECRFLHNNKCTIHEVKPIQCKHGPFGFFWDGKPRFECMRHIVVPPNWNTLAKDLEIIEQLKFTSNVTSESKNSKKAY